MKMTIFVHDFHKEIGHSRALIESLNSMNEEKKKNIEKITIVAFSCSPLEQVLDGFKGKATFHKVLLPPLRPFILKMFLYHAYSLFYSWFVPCGYKIGIGVACLNVDLANVQFLHGQWKEKFFVLNKLNVGQWIYKKILFIYFDFCEWFLFKVRKPRITVLANFMKTFLLQEMSVKQEVSVAYSGVNLSDFNVKPIDDKKILEDLVIRYPQLKILDFTRPIYLFVGAFERKGFFEIFKLLEKDNPVQLVAVGGSTNDAELLSKIPGYINFVHIKHTKEVDRFYQLADVFIFPTYYEPFGLVILEAYVMGLDLYVNKINVGASEIIAEDEGVIFLDLMAKNKRISLRKEKLGLDEKLKRRQQRIENLRSYSWENNSKIQYSEIFEDRIL